MSTIAVEPRALAYTLRSEASRTRSAERRQSIIGRRARRRITLQTQRRIPPHTAAQRRVRPPDAPGWLAEGSIAARSARRAGQGCVRLRDAVRDHPDLLRAVTALALLSVGVILVLAAALVDSYIHRGVDSGSEPPFVVQPTGGEFATNVDLTLFPQSELPSVAETLRESGFRYVRQHISWRQVEQSQGQFDWAAYDVIVDQLARQEVSIVAVVHEAPEWARGDVPSGVSDAPPRDAATFGAFVEALTARYGDRVPYVQLWEAPNDPVYWGAQGAPPESFLPVLAAGFNAANAGFPEVKVMLPELAIDPDGAGAQSDLSFLEGLYDAGGSAFFDIVAVRLDGGQLSPEDRRVDGDRINFSRAILFRELLFRADDATTPIWATSFGWAVGGDVSAEDQAAFVVDGIQRAWAEWPWMGLMFHWAFVVDPDTAASAYAMVDPDGRATPLYLQVTSDELMERSTVAETGFAPMDSAAVIYEGDWQPQHLEGRTFQTTSQTQSAATITFHGTGLIGFLRFGPESGLVHLSLDGELVPGGGGNDGLAWNLGSFVTSDLPQTLVSGLDNERHRLTIELVSEGELTLGGLVVVRQEPFLWPIILLAVGAAVAIFLAVRSLLYLVAVRSGQLQRRTGVDLWPQLPQLPDWRPSRRV